MSDSINLILALILLLLNAFFVAAEFSLVTIRGSRLEELTRKGHKRADLVRNAVANMDRYLSTVQLGITVTSLGIGWLGEPAFAHMIKTAFPGLSANLSTSLSYGITFGVAFALITSLHITLGELLPKMIAIAKPESVAFWTIRPLILFYYIAFVPMWVLNSVVKFLLKILRIEPDHRAHLHSNEEIKILLDRNEEAGELSLGRLMMFENLFDFGQATIREVLTPADRIVYLSFARSWEENLAIIRTRKFSKYPLCREGLESVVGYVHIKDIVLLTLDKFTQSADLAQIQRNVRFFKESDRLEMVLNEFQKNTYNMVLVENESGTVSGLLTVEDVLEEIVGEIRDEFEAKPAFLLSRYFVRGACEFNLNESDPYKAMRLLLERLHKKRPVFNLEDTWLALQGREMALTTAVGHEAAFPHARLTSIKEPLVVFGRSSNGVDFPSPDKKKVKLIFLILTPTGESNYQLRILSQLSRLLTNETLHDKLCNAKNSDELAEILATFQERVPV